MKKKKTCTKCKKSKLLNDFPNHKETRDGKDSWCVLCGNKAVKKLKKKNPTYMIWSGMKSRCFNPKDYGYKNYGGRGITVCKRWLVFKNFYDDMGNPPKGMTLERKNNTKNYELSNCKWATNKDQSNNRRNNRLTTFKGKTMTTSQWAEKIGITRQGLFYRLQQWSIEKALTVFIRKRRK